MVTTRKTLLWRVRDSGDSVAWDEFFALYAPLLASYARAHGLGPADADEVRDQCLAVVAQRMPDFEYAREQGSFKAWLYRIAKGKIVDVLRRPREEQPATAALLALPARDEQPDEIWERRWRDEHLRYALGEALRGESESTRRVFELVLADDLSVAELCERTGLNANQIYKARSRLLRRVHEVLQRLGTDV